MGRRKGSKNKKTLAKMGRRVAGDPVAWNMCYEALHARVAALESKADLHTSPPSIPVDMSPLLSLEERLETLCTTLDKLLLKVSSIENTLSPLTFIERASKGSENGNQNESQESGQEAR